MTPPAATDKITISTSVSTGVWLDKDNQAARRGKKPDQGSEYLHSPGFRDWNCHIAAFFAHGASAAVQVNQRGRLTFICRRLHGLAIPGACDSELIPVWISAR